jgi:hypothetical protein
MSDRAEIRREERVPRRCANEGCGKTSEGRYCDACALEWSLFHREERGPVRPTDRRSD